MSPSEAEQGEAVSEWWDKFTNFAWRTDWTQVVIISALGLLGWVAIRSAGEARASLHHENQAVFLGLGWAVYWAVSSLDYRKVIFHARTVYLVTLGLLLPVSVCALLDTDLGDFIRKVYAASR